MNALRLISFELCPFVQRATFALQTKGVPHDIEYIDLSAKPDWFMAISPLGKVPVLEVDGVALFESGPICEYLDEVYGPQLHPADPIQKARDRAWIDASAPLGGHAYGMMVAKTEEACRAAAANARTTLEKLQAELAGPFWRGDAPCMVDASVAPMLQRIFWCEELADLGVTEGLDAIKLWTESMMALPAFQHSILPNARALFHAYLQQTPAGGAPGDTYWLGTKVGLTRED